MAENTTNSMWSKILQGVFAMPGIAVDREDFLRRQLKGQSDDLLSELIENKKTVGQVLGNKEAERLANSVINSHTIIATSVSTIAGFPGGIAMAAAIGADVFQYYYNVFVVAQKLAYLYGYPDLRDDNGKLSEAAASVLTVFVGVMSGTATANQAMKVLSQSLRREAVRQLPKYALTKTLPYQLARAVAAEIGLRLSKSTFAKGVSKAIPIIGGLISGTVTLATFRPQAKKLLNELKKGQ